MSEQKTCPLLAAGDPDHTPVSAWCKGDRCAWAYSGGCAITTIVRCLVDLNEHGIITWPEGGQ